MNAIRIMPLLALLVAPVSAADHSKYIESVEDQFDPEHPSKICIVCHDEEAKEVFESPHYQWAGEVEDIVGRGTIVHGKRYAYNDFCGAVFYRDIPINWIGKVTNEEGKVIATGCSLCHPSYGLVPQKEMNEEQLNNIDCLVCHAKLQQS